MKANQKESEPQTRMDEFIFLEFDKIPAAQKAQPSERCPDCDNPVFRSGGCPVCMRCGWSTCG